MVRNIHKKRPIDDCSNSRGLLLSSCIGKVYGGALRRRLLPAALEYAADTQCGRFPGRSPEFASHCVRLFAARCKARGWSHAIVFLDATSAFYSLMRQWVLGFNETEDCLRQLCAKVGGIPNADEMISMASRNPILVHAGASKESVALARDWHTSDWISVEHVDEKRFCAKGTRLSDVLADLVFNVAMSWVITQARSQVPLHEVFASSSALPFPALDDSVAVSCSDVSFVDDFALLVASASPTDLLDDVRKHVRAYSELLAVFGLSLNMSPGKTEAFVTFCCQGAKDAASKLVHQDDHSHVPLHDGTLLRSVRSSVHLGTLTTPSGSYAQEVSRRTQSMLHAYLPLAKSTFGEPSFPIKTRLVLAESLLITRLTFALGSRDPLPLGLKRSMEAARMRVFRMILGEFRKEGGLSDRAVREKLGVCSFDVLVRRHRLLYASRVARKAPSLLHALLQNVGGAMIPWLMIWLP